MLITTIHFSSCTDKLPEPPLCNTVEVTYNAHVEEILNANCELSGCHDGNSQIDFGTYSSLDAARKDLIYQRVCVSFDMPELPHTISSGAVDSIRCWKESGFLEN